MLQKSLAIQVKALGKGHFSTAISYGNIGDLVMQDKGDLDGALEMYHYSLKLKGNN